MKTKPRPETADACSTDSFAVGACDGPGLCPGVALLLAYAIGGGVGMMTGLPWLGWTVGIPLGLVLLTGAWRWLPGRRVASPRVDTNSTPSNRHS